MIKVHNFKIDNIKDNSVVYISNAQDNEMMFVCESHKDGTWTLYSNEYKHYSPAFDSLEEMKELLQEDWLNGEITDIDVFECDGEEIES